MITAGFGAVTDAIPSFLRNRMTGALAAQEATSVATDPASAGLPPPTLPWYRRVPRWAWIVGGVVLAGGVVLLVPKRK